MKILVSGSSGLLGKRIIRNLHKSGKDVVGISRRAGPFTSSLIDLSVNSYKIFNLLNLFNPSAVIHCAAMTHVDACENNKREAYTTNVKATQAIAEWCIDNHARLVYISSDYVYPGNDNGYDESSPVGPVNFYAQTKLGGEIAVRQVPHHLILRPVVIFGYDKNSQNYFMQMLSLRDIPKPREVPYDQISNPTEVGLLARSTISALEQGLEGVYVATGPESMNRLTFSQMIADKIGFSRELLFGMSTHDLMKKYPGMAPRPLNNGTNSSKFYHDLGIIPPTVALSLDEVIASIE